MDKIICEKDDLVAVADNIRTLTGTTGEMTLAEMAAVEGSGGGGAGTIETCTINIIDPFGSVNHWVYTTYRNGAVVIEITESYPGTCSLSVVVGTLIYVETDSIPNFILTEGIVRVEADTSRNTTFIINSDGDISVLDEV